MGEMKEIEEDNIFFFIDALIFFSMFMVETDLR
jgi:hypothetical protein